MPIRVALLTRSRWVSPWLQQAVRGTEEVLQAADCLVQLSAQPERSLRGRAYLRWLRAQGADGAIDFGHEWSDELRRPVEAWRFPLVYLGYLPRNLQANSIRGDEDQAARLVLEHLLALGYRRCGYLIAVDRPHPAIRLAAFQRQAERLGAWDPGLVLDLRAEYAPNRLFSTLALGRNRRVKAFFRKCPTPLAMFCHNDYVAAALLEWLLERGRSVPEEVAVVGMDNDPIYALANGGLTTVEMPTEQMGRQAARLLLSRLRRGGSTRCRDVQLPQRLVVRRSTVIPARTAPWLQTVLGRVRERIDGPRYAEALAAAVGWRRETLARRFRQVMGCSLREYRDRVRLERAAQLLQEVPEAKVATIAREAGVASPGRFAALFRRYFGLGPAEYRRSRESK